MRSLVRLNHFYWKYKHLFIPGLLCAIISAIFSVTVPVLVRQVVDGIPPLVNLYHLYEGTRMASLVLGFSLVMLLMAALVIIALSILSGIFSFLMRRTIVVASRHIEFDLRNTLYNHLQSLSPSFYHKNATGDVITRATSDIEQVRRYIGPALMYITRAVVIMVTAVVVMTVISPQLTFYALLPMPLLAVSVFFMARMVHSRSDALQVQYSSLTSRVQEALAGIRVLKAYTGEGREAEAFEEESRIYRTRVLDLARVDAAWRPIFLLLIGLSQIIVVWMGGRLVVEGVITIGNIVEYIIYVSLMTWPVASVGFVITMVQRASASMIRLNDILDTPPAIADTDETDIDVQHLEGRISFENVSFRYEEEGPLVLEDITFDLPAGAFLAIVGRTGSGKSTLVEMIPRLLDPQAGVVRIDGMDVRKVPLHTVRAATGFVPQEVFLFSDTVANNIAFGRLEAGEEAIVQATTEAELFENVSSFPNGFETFVGERGITLSGGQKQRTSIARALLRQPRILVLDDALSAVDTRTERQILNHLRQHYGQRTLVLVSHRISAVQEADLILVLDEGRIVERGTHAQLIQGKGLYAGLYQKQLLEEELAALS